MRVRVSVRAQARKRARVRASERPKADADSPSRDVRSASDAPTPDAPPLLLHIHDSRSARAIPRVAAIDHAALPDPRDGTACEPSSEKTISRSSLSESHADSGPHDSAWGIAATLLFTRQQIDACLTARATLLHT